MGTRWPMTPAGARSAQDLTRRADLVNPQGANFVDPVNRLHVALSADGTAVNISFQVSVLTGLASIVILRNATRDATTATVVQSFEATALAAGQPVNCQDGQTPAAGTAFYYWAKAVPAAANLSPTFHGPRTVGSVSVDTAAVALQGFSISKSAAVNGLVTITVSYTIRQPPVQPLSPNPACRLYAAGYQGNASAVAVAESPTSPFQFTMNATAEVVTFTARGVNADGLEQPSPYLSATLTLNSTETVPCQVLDCVASLVSTGIQFDWTADLEPDITHYKLYGFLPAFPGAAAFFLSYFSSGTLLATIPNPGAGVHASYVDTAGFTNAAVWWLVASGPAGDAAPSPGMFIPASASSALLPNNSIQNATNLAMVDSIDSGGSATVRIYSAAGGLGTAWTAQYGWGSQSFQAGSILGLAYSTYYYIVYDGSAYHAYAGFPSVIPDGFIYAGTVATVAPGGGGGISGGGGAAGGHGGHPYNLYA